MKKFISTTLFLFATTISVFAQETEEPKIDVEKAKKEIVNVFTTYKNAIVKNDVKSAILQLDKSSFSYYDEILNTSLRADEAQLNQLDILDRLMVLTVKHRVPKDQLIKMNGKDLLIYALENDIINNNRVEKMGIGDIEINGDIAYGQFLQDNKNIALYLGFSYDQSQWRLDVTSLAEPTGFAIRKLVEMQNKDENEVIFMMIEASTPNQKISKDIWKPIL
ncbi:hypothetical protein [Faecalibacter bovis]|uniref:DUF4252 domain-containing protein n=1 Tax=Faecalibacter bovis TaxID=2898187 RepID=A0ABX7XCW9_9FLAO|nr:hypothetical protein [Faecalibacter bovis]QTV05771.1 hypothetical protein J9309_13560 [Faecalibacter bovis]